MTFVVFGAAAVAVGLVSAVVWIVRRRHTPEELRGDWWTDFEADFRAYGRGGAKPSRPPERRPGTESTPG